jgi:hypothetical protein
MKWLVLRQDTEAWDISPRCRPCDLRPPVNPRQFRHAGGSTDCGPWMYTA